MYAELIYTRCRDGVDLLKGLTPVKGGAIGGFKIYSCSTNVILPNFTDIKLLDTVRAWKQSYLDPSFMDDAYLYFTPESGVRYYMNFHPLHFDKSDTQGDYPHRPGNFVNQVFLGDFFDVYPFELFGCDSVWDAQKRGEAYYYEHSPEPLQPRASFADCLGNVNRDDLKEFITGPRKKLLADVVAFLIGQFSHAPESRKYLVIKDSNARNIELWIAAIESAFSPRMASGLSFATRLDKFQSVNKYTINLSGQYQSQINLQSPNQKLRYHAMIVGVDARDSANISAARALPNAPFVVLDGIANTFSAQVEASNPYYQLITSFSDEHEFFCREFLQSIDITAPSEDVFSLFSTYQAYQRYRSTASLQELVSVLSSFNKYKLVNSTFIRKFYASVKSNLANYLQADPINAFAVLDWLKKEASTVGDHSATAEFNDEICAAFESTVFVCPGSQKTAALWKTIKSSTLLGNVSERIIEGQTKQENRDAMKAFTGADWESFSTIYASCIRNARASLISACQYILKEASLRFYQENAGPAAVKTVKLFSEIDWDGTKEMMLSDAASNEDHFYRSYLVQALYRAKPILSSPWNDIQVEYQQFQRYGLQSLFPHVLAVYAEQQKSPQAMERMLDRVLESAGINSLDLSPFLSSLDRNVTINDAKYLPLSRKIQQHKPASLMCINSAHVVALDLLDGRNVSPSLLVKTQDLVKQGFPSVENNDYADQLVTIVFSGHLLSEVFDVITAASSRSAFYSEKMSAKALTLLGSFRERLLVDFITCCSRANTASLTDALKKSCANQRPYEKAMTAIKLMLRDRNVRDYFMGVEKEARILYEQNKGPSLFGKLFGK